MQIYVILKTATKNIPPTISLEMTHTLSQRNSSGRKRLNRSMNIIIMDKLLRILDPYDFDLAGSTPDPSNVRMPGNDIYINALSLGRTGSLAKISGTSFSSFETRHLDRHEACGQWSQLLAHKWT